MITTRILPQKSFLKIIFLASLFLLLSCNPSKKSDSIQNSDTITTIDTNINTKAPKTIIFQGISSNRWLKAYDNIFFGMPDSLASIQQAYLDFLANYRTTIANVKFYYYPAYERYDFNYFGLMSFSLISDDEYDLSDTRLILNDIKIRIDGKYQNCQFIHRSKETKEMREMHETFNKNLAKAMKENSLKNYDDSTFPKLKDGDKFCEYRWERNGIRIELCYLKFYRWVDNDDFVIDQYDKNAIIKYGLKQKPFYQPYLLFVNDKAIDLINSEFDFNIMKYKKKNLENDINKF